MTRYQTATDRHFAALADPTRRAIVERLVQGPAAVSDLAEPFGMALPTVMQHLKVLQDSGLIRSHKQGRVRTCEIDGLALQGVESWFAARIRTWESRLNRLDALALRLAAEDLAAQDLAAHDVVAKEKEKPDA